jgi:membrane-associated phospholipid phosphatase
MRNKGKAFKIRFLTMFFFCATFLNAQNTDITILRAVNVHRNENLDPSFKFVSNSVVPLSVVTPLIIYSVGLIQKDSTVKKQAIFIGETFLVSAFITTALKHAIKRERPFDAYSDIEKATSAAGYSFPSGHTSVAFATATSLSMAYPKWFVIAPSFIWASAVGYSRMHLGVHYPSDVLAGALVGSGSAYLTDKANKWLNKKRSKKKS